LTADGLDHLRGELNKLRMGHEIVEYVFIGGNLLEFCLAVGCILLALYHAFLTLYHKTRFSAPRDEMDVEDPTTRLALVHDSTDEQSGNIESEEVVNLRYMHEAEFWLVDLPRLQNLSLFRLLAFAHPVLLDKRWRQFTSKNEMSRAILESFFGCKDKYLTDEQLVDQVANLIIQSGPSLEKDNRAEDLWNLDLWKALKKLRACKGSLNFDRQHNQEALDQAWRLNLLLFGERIFFGVLVNICFVVGSLEFFHKICRCTLMLTDQDTFSMTDCLIYFALFLNQTIGMMHVGLLLRLRVETFIFGGTDALVSTEERYVMRVYLALLVERIWDLDLNVFQKIAIMLSLDDDDLQQLVVEESESKNIVTASIRQFMDKRGLSSKVYAALKNAVSG